MNDFNETEFRKHRRETLTKLDRKPNKLELLVQFAATPFLVTQRDGKLKNDVDAYLAVSYVKWAPVEQVKAQLAYNELIRRAREYKW